MGILYACLIADGVQHHDETTQLIDMVIGEPKFEGIDFRAVFRKVGEEEIEIGGLEMVRACAKLVAPEERAKVYALAMRIVLADGTIDGDEALVINVLQKELQISDDDSERILDQFTINR